MVIDKKLLQRCPDIICTSSLLEMRKEMVRCAFEAVYNDLEKGEKYTPWRCEEPAGKSDICVYHDKNTPSWDNNTISRFTTKVKKCIGNNETLYCIGYYFPMNISFRRLFSYNPTLIGPIQRDTSPYTYHIAIYLSESEFEGQVEFSYCTFKKPLNLSGVVFNRGVLFRMSVFEDEFYPRNTKFLENVNFWKAQFKNADFHDTLFKDKANFHDAIFEGDDTRFLDVNFEGRANFESTHFNCKIEFDGTTFNQAKFSNVEFNDIAKFRKVIFGDGEKVNFDVPKMENVSFLNTDISRVKFAENICWGGDKGFTVIDERELESKLKKKKAGVEDNPDLESIKAIYRNLRENCEYRLRYDEAGQFFIRELELKRNYSRNDKGEIGKTHWLRRNFSLTGFYRLATYGEKFRMPILFIMSVILGAFFVSISQINSAVIAEHNQNVILAVGNATEKVVTTFLQLRNEHLIWSDYIIKVLGIVSLGLFAIPLRRKFERKFRH